MQNYFNSGMKVFGENNNNPQCTFVVTGISRSGTTMIVKVLKKLGIYIGVTEKGVYECSKCRTLLESNRIEEFKAFVENNNNQYDVWGWKRPIAFKYSAKYLPIIRNPKFIIPFRDSLATTIRSIVSGIAKEESFLNIAKQNLGLIEFVFENNIPKLCVSYEKCMFQKEIFVEALIDFLKIEPTNQQKIDAIESIQNGNQDYIKSSIHPKKRI